MATPESLRRSIAELTGLARRDLDALWRQVADLGQAQVALNDVLPALIATYGEAAAAIAADWYDEIREDREVKGRYRADVPVISAENVGAAALTGWARTTATDLPAMRSLIEGGTQRRIANAARRTVMTSSYDDPQATGWRRVARSNGCGFCVMLARRDAIYTERSVRFGAHDECGCQAAPEFAGKADVVDVDAYRASTRRRSDETRAADNARARAWIADNL